MSTYLTTQEVADRLGVSVFTIRRYVRNGKLKAVKLDGVIRISRDDLAEFLKAREVGFVPGIPDEPAAGRAKADGEDPPTMAEPLSGESISRFSRSRSTSHSR